MNDRPMSPFAQALFDCFKSSNLQEQIKALNDLRAEYKTQPEEDICILQLMTAKNQD